MLTIEMQLLKGLVPLFQAFSREYNSIGRLGVFSLKSLNRSNNSSLRYNNPKYCRRVFSP
jgi:hypothetical protein